MKMFGVCFYNPNTDGEYWEWYNTKEACLRGVKNFYHDNVVGKTEISFEDWVDTDVSFMVEYSYEEIKNLF